MITHYISVTAEMLHRMLDLPMNCKIVRMAVAHEQKVAGDVPLTLIVEQEVPDGGYPTTAGALLCGIHPVYRYNQNTLEFDGWLHHGDQNIARRYGVEGFVSGEWCDKNGVEYERICPKRAITATVNGDVVTVKGAEPCQS